MKLSFVIPAFNEESYLADCLESILAQTRGLEALTEIIVVNTGQRLSAYRNECAHEGLPLDNAVLDIYNGTLTCPWHGFCYDATSGECLSAPGAQLEQVPLRIDSGEGPS